jgi:hypothetical protein
LTDIQYFTAGSGDWRRLLPAGPVRDFYGQIYPRGRRWADLPVPLLEACRAWVECDLARADGDRLTPLIPIMLQQDREVLQPWVESLAAETVAAVREALSPLRQIAGSWSDSWNSVAHLISILILWSVNLWVLARLLDAPLGPHPRHGTTGRYFIWGEAMGGGPVFISGIRTFQSSRGDGLCLLVSRLVARPVLQESRRLYAPVRGISAVDLLAALAWEGPSLEALAQRWSVDERVLRCWCAEQVKAHVLSADGPPRVRVPVFGPEALIEMTPVCDGIAERITAWMLEDGVFDFLLEQCSFARCPRSAVLCMVWHTSYYEATDCLVAQDILPPFPSLAEGEWGVWLTSPPFGQARPSRLARR